MSDYPESSELRRLYPDIGIKVLRQENDEVYAYQTLNGRVLPYVTWRASTIEQVEIIVLKMWHWEKTGKTLPIPISIPKDNVILRKVTIPDQEVPSKLGVAIIGSIWMHNNATAERVRIKETEKEEYFQKGFILGKKFTLYVDPKRVERVALEKKTAYLAALKESYYAKKNMT